VFGNLHYFPLSLYSRLGEEYADIAERALTVPGSTEELMALIEYVQAVESETVVEMEDRLRVVVSYMLFLADYTTYSPIEMKHNSITLQWYNRMPNVFDENRAMCEQKTVEFQEALKVDTPFKFLYLTYKC